MSKARDQDVQAVKGVKKIHPILSDAGSSLDSARKILIPLNRFARDSTHALYS